MYARISLIILVAKSYVHTYSELKPDHLISGVRVLSYAK